MNKYFVVHRRHCRQTEPLRRSGVQIPRSGIIFGRFFCFQKSSAFVLRGSVTDVERLSLAVGRLIELIEEHGLLTDGIYRKSGPVTKVKKLQGKLKKAVSSTRGLTNITRLDVLYRVAINDWQRNFF